MLIAKRNGKPFKVLAGSTNFSWRGIYIQANNVLVFDDPAIAALYGSVFDAAFKNPAAFKSDDLASKWHLVQSSGQASDPLLLLAAQVVRSLAQPGSRSSRSGRSPRFSTAVAFLNQIKSGPTKEAFDRLMKRPVFSYGVSDEVGNLEIRKPDGTIGLVDFAYLA